MLILTIIIMIILATAVILSLNSSGIISKAQSAKEASDKATVKEYVSMLEAEWELMSEDERKDYSSKEDYIDKKLEEKGYKDIYYTENGIILTANAKKALEDGLEIGDVIEYTVTAMEEPEESKEADNGYGLQYISNQTNLTWRYIGISDDGKIMIAPDVTNDAPQLYLKGSAGYLKGPAEINRLCGALYTTDKGTARSMTIEDVNNLLGYTGEKGSYYDSNNNYQPLPEPLTIQQVIDTKGEHELVYSATPDGDIGTYELNWYIIDKENDVGKMTYPEHRQFVYYDSYYWLASSCCYCAFHHVGNGFDCAYFGVRLVSHHAYETSESRVDFCTLYYSDDPSDREYDCASLRPIVSINSNVKLSEISDGMWSLT